MAITRNPLLQYESGQAFNDWEPMSDAGDDTTFSATFAPWSGRAGFETDVRPFGLATGGTISAGSGNDAVSVASLTAYMPTVAGADSTGLVVVASGSVSVTRASTSTHIINSIIVDASGALVAVQGSEGTAFTETRGEAGGPRSSRWIPWKSARCAWRPAPPPRCPIPRFSKWSVRTASATTSRYGIPTRPAVT
ncbi:hypothetical protein [Modicisalibacter luteus]|uniref:hypothetical protein n=1 Tax=Modicisalibacter luteus TaxID=453962 RepID=UPI003632829E